MSHVKTIGIDLAKNKFHIACLDEAGKKISTKKLNRDEVLAYLQTIVGSETVVAMEACGSSHYWAQEIQKLGVTVKLYKPSDVKAYASTKQKNDINDALSIAKTALDSDRRTVAIKTREQQQVCFLHKRRKQLIEQRIQNTNELRAVLSEFGVVDNLSPHLFITNMGRIVETAHVENHFMDSVYQVLQEMVCHIQNLQQQIKRLDKEIIDRNKSSEMAKRFTTIPGIGPINASILEVCPFESYDNPRDFAASLGLVPTQNTTGGKIRLGSITKKGSRYIRSTLIQGARSLLIHAANLKRQGKQLCALKTWALQKCEELGFNKAAVAVANKLARIIWAVGTTGSIYDAR